MSLTALSMLSLPDLDCQILHLTSYCNFKYIKFSIRNLFMIKKFCCFLITKRGMKQTGSFSAKWVRRGYKPDLVYWRKCLLLKNASKITKYSVARTTFLC